MALKRTGSIGLAAVLMAGSFWFTGCKSADEEKTVSKGNDTAKTPKLQVAANAGATGGAESTDEGTTASEPAELDLRAGADVAAETPQAAAATVTPTAEVIPTTGAETAAAAPTAAPAADTGEGANKLADSSSPYLRSAAKSPIHWLPWGEEAFARAKELDRPVLIDSGAIWCHWCHVMDHGTYADPEVVRTLNENFVAVKIDRDERPDVDERYQTAHYLINQKGGGWPLTVFALPDGRAFESLTYVPAETQGSQVGMRDILKQVLAVYKDRRPDVEKQAEQIQAGMAEAAKRLAAKGTANKALFDKIAKDVKASFDKENGGFGTAAGPKFPQGNVLLFLLQYYADTEDKAALDIVAKTLTAYFKGGLRDQVLGGYFRYTTDGKLSRPHYEKMLYVQAELLSSFSIAHAATEKKMFKEAAQDILQFCRDTLENPDGGFYASQDADIGPGDDGSYYTWTAEEIRKIAGEGVETDIFMHYMNVAGEQNTDEKGRSTLRSDKPLQASADEFKVTYAAAQTALNNVRKKLRTTRYEQEKIPYVDKSILASWNALTIRAYLDAYRYCGDEQARDFALKSINFIVEKMLSPEQGVAHVLGRGKASQYGLLEDQVLVASALVSCYEVAQQKEYLETAESLMNYVEKTFLDETTGLYVDRRATEGQIGLLAVDRFAVFDNPTPAPNPMAAITWYKLFEIAKKPEYKERYTRMVNAVAGQQEVDGLAAATYGRAVGIGLAAQAPDDAASAPAGAASARTAAQE